MRTVNSLRQPPLSRRRAALLLLFLPLAALFFVPTLIALLTDWWWFQEIGYRIVFIRELLTRLLLFLSVGGLTFLVLYVNLRTAQRGIAPDSIVLRLGQSIPRGPQVDVTRPLQRASLPVSLFLALLAGLAGASALELGVR